MLSAASVPVYALDADRRIVYLNEACADWLGIAAHELLDERCDYHSSQEAPPAVRAAAALCPPPEVFAGVEASTDVSTLAEDSSQPTRTARFLPLGNTPGSCAGVIAILSETQNLKSRSSSEDWPRRLHAELADFHKAIHGRYVLGRLAGNSPARRRAREQAVLAAATDAPVLIFGQPGSGRRHVGHTIHALSAAPSRIVPLDCAVAPQGLVEHLALRAAPASGQEQTRDTLLLVEVDQLAVEAQATLAAQVAKANYPYRIIATAGRPLVDLAAQGRFREDLACRLSVLSIELPGLAELSDDLPLLAQWFLEAENSRGQKQLAGFSDAAMEVLLAYHWPSNIDELAEVVREAHRAAGQVWIASDDLPRRLRLAADAAIQGSRDTPSIELEPFLAQVELRLVRQALEASDGNKSQAAKRLGMSRQRLYRRLVQLGLEKAE
jgi:DNA-binding NtrC family response regulator